jgi:hypothetical protein
MYGYILIQNGFRWTAEELQKVIDMLSRPLVREIMEDPIFIYIVITVLRGWGVCRTAL